MNKTKKERPLYQRLAIDIAGFGLMIISPFLGWLPGPGGIPLFLAGLGLVSLNHEWARNLLKDFERRRDEFTDKYLMSSPRVSLTIDVVFTLALIVGLFLAITQTPILLRGAGLFTTSISLIILLSNQKRFERIAKMFKKHKR
ncbi:MAG: hypothetical protein ACR2FM_01185 [Candidatus Saccharimonadales bacterium]